jgi:carbamoyl-phosphate synthase large subunit
MLEESVLGWKEYELEVMRDFKDNVVIICSIENFDPMGVHTGDSITVAPAQTLTDKEYQTMRDASLAIIREIGVETGGSNIQFAVHPGTGEMVVIEMNPRVSRSSALASKATGFPIAKIAAKLAVGYTLDEIPNDITKETMASFEPTIDYCVVKIPRWTFEKFPGSEDYLTTSMKSVGEAMAIGRTFKEALQKGIRSLEIGRFGFGADGKDLFQIPLDEIQKKMRQPNSQRIFYLKAALEAGMTIEEINAQTSIDPWFLHNLSQILVMEKTLAVQALETLSPELLQRAKEYGFSDVQLGHLLQVSPLEIFKKRQALKMLPVYKLVDTCAAEFEAYTPYYYSTYDLEDESRASEKERIMILGGGPNRIGQGIEFDYCCVHASLTAKEEGYASIMVNSNPETVSTDYDISDKLYFEPLTHEDVFHIIDREKPKGVIVQFGGQTPLNLAMGLQAVQAPIIGTSPDSIDRAEDRERFKELLKRLGLIQPENGTAFTTQEAQTVAESIGFPVVVRPSYVLGGRAMEIVYEPAALETFMAKAVLVSPGHPILIDKFLEEAIEIDVDAVSDGRKTVICGIMEHIEEAGIHSGDSACVLPPYTLSADQIDRIKSNTYALALELGVRGLMNIQYAIKDDILYVLEVNPRASRTIPFVSKATGIPWAKVATRVMLGRDLESQGLKGEIVPDHISVKESVFPFLRFPGVDTLLGPEMKSTGEVMGIDHSFGLAFAKSQLAAGMDLPLTGTVFISVKDQDKKIILSTAQKLSHLGFKVMATSGTSRFLEQAGLPNQKVNKVREGRPHIVDLMKNGEVQLVINTTIGSKSVSESCSIRQTALIRRIPYTTTVAGARATAEAIEVLQQKKLSVRTIQEYHGDIKK